MAIDAFHRTPVSLILFVLAAFFTTSAHASGGVAVGAVDADSRAERAGLQPGMVLAGWSVSGKNAGSGKIDVWTDWYRVRMEYLERAPVTFLCLRGNEPLSITVEAGAPGIDVRPALKGSLLERYLAGKNAQHRGEFDAMAASWYRVAAELQEAERDADASWLLVSVAEAYKGAKLWEDAERAYREAMAPAVQSGRPLALAYVQEKLGLCKQRRGEYGAAESAYRRALELASADGDAPLLTARFWHLLGYVCWERGDLDTAETWYAKALKARGALAPGSMELSRTLNNMGIVADDRGDLEAAAERYGKALAIKEKWVPESLSVAMTVNNLGALAAKAGKYREAEKLYRRALALYEKLSPGTLRPAKTLNNLSIVVREQGRLAEAESLCRRSLEQKRELAPDSLSLASSLNTMGILTWIRGDYGVAEDLYREALGIRKRLAPESLTTAIFVGNLGQISMERGDVEAAADYYDRALRLTEALAPGSLDAARVLGNMAVLAGWIGDNEESMSLHGRAYAIRREKAPDSPDTANSLVNLSNQANLLGDQRAAEDYARQALAIQKAAVPGGLDTLHGRFMLAKALLAQGRGDEAEKELLEALETARRLAPGTANEAKIHHQLGLRYWKVGNLRRARESLEAAVEAFESQRGKVGGSEDARAVFSSWYRCYYQDLMDLLLEMGQKDAAFAVMERSRARGLLAMIARRDLVFGLDLPEELEARRRIANARYDKVLEEIASVSPEAEPDREKFLRSELLEIRREQESVKKAILKASPRLAALQYPEPAEVSQAREVLDPGTVLLSYSVDEDGVLLFVLGPGAEDLQVHSIPVEEKRLALLVRRFRHAVKSLQETGPWGADLTETLLAPAADRIAGADRVLICPDGPLHYLPFGALADPAGGESYWIETKPIHHVISMSVYRELLKDRGTMADGSVMAFGDPRYPWGSGDWAEPPATLRSFIDRGFTMEPLPSTRAEVGEIRSLYASRAEVKIGPEATEEGVKDVSQATSVLHLACHGLLDEDVPLDSALVLTIPRKGEDRDNGLLQAWEVFETLRIDADLVVLSACETGLGRELKGEGLVGLTRAFQYAGARSIVASLWSVADESTSWLMRAFYRNLREGMAKDEALRRAQMALIETSGDARDVSHPFYWAAFELIGDCM